MVQHSISIDQYLDELIRKEHYERATEFVEEQDLERSMQLFLHGYINFKRRDYHQAKKYLKESLALQPSAQAHYYLGDIAVRETKYVKANAHLLDALKLAPSGWELHDDTMALLGQLERFDPEF